MRDLPRPDYLKVHFRAEVPPYGLPKRFGIVTAYNPNGKPAWDEDNIRKDAELSRYLKDSGLPHFRVTGGPRDLSHGEPGFAIVASLETIRSISRAFRQEAFFWIESDEVIYVINTAGKIWHPVGRWQERLNKQ